MENYTDVNKNPDGGDTGVIRGWRGVGGRGRVFLRLYNFLKLDRATTSMLRASLMWFADTGDALWTYGTTYSCSSTLVVYWRTRMLEGQPAHWMAPYSYASILAQQCTSGRVAIHPSTNQNRSDRCRLLAHPSHSMDLCSSLVHRRRRSLRLGGL